MAKKEEIQAGIEEMRAQLDAAKTAVPEKEEPVAEESVDLDSSTEGFSEKFADLLEDMNKELKETNPVALLGVFVLGLVVGRLFSR